MSILRNADTLAFEARNWRDAGKPEAGRQALLVALDAVEREAQVARKWPTWAQINDRIQLARRYLVGAP